jgi:uncharacterized OsmC-like protein
VRQIDAGPGRLVGEAVGDVETENSVLVLRRIHVRLRLKARPEHGETVRRVHGFFAEACPVYRSLRAAIATTTEAVLEGER